MAGVLKDRTGEVSYTKNGTPAIIVEYVDSKNALIEFQDKYKYQYRTSYYNFKNGHMTNPYECRNAGGIGFIGVGKYNTKDHIEAYLKWKRIIDRCRNDKNRKYSEESYMDCTICEDWKNFQEFADWYYNNLYDFNGVLCVDKDILVHGNTIYSPKTCLIVPERINLLFIKEKARRGNLPIGVQYSSNGEKYSAWLSLSGKDRCKYLGTYNTVDEAFSVYKNKKEEFIKRIANEYKSIIPKVVYDALCNYEVLITD